MRDLKSRIECVSANDLHWSFANPFPKVQTRPRVAGCYSNSVEVDPFPAYPHEYDTVIATAEKVETVFPVGFAPTYYVMHFEESGRTNGQFHRHWISEPGTPSPMPFDPYIVLGGKRTPIHPAQTRYLVAHEYGHVVQAWIEWRRYIKDSAVTDFEREYAAMRGVPDSATTDYGGGRWHKAIGEIIANDFRILVAGVEPEFWPHSGFARPEDVDGLASFWADMLDKHATDKPERPPQVTGDTKPE